MDYADDSAKANKLNRNVVNFGRQIQIGLSPKLGAKSDRLADMSRIKLTGYIRARAGEPPTIDIKRIIELKNLASDGRSAERASDWED